MMIGVTGGLATGTSTAAGYLAEGLNATLIDADKLAHSLLQTDKAVIGAIVGKFGRSVLKKNKAVDRQRLADKAFADKGSLKKLCDIVHPKVIDRIRKLSGKARRGGSSCLVVLDAPVLIESGFYKECDLIVVVIASLGLQLERARAFKDIDIDDALSRIKCQMPLFKKAGYADYIIDNGSDLSELKKKCEKIADEIRKTTHHAKKAGKVKKRG